MRGSKSEGIPAEDRQALDLSVGTVFTPAAPVSKKDLFAGRLDPLREVIDAINQPGQHVVIFGERGVGKTSLANVLSEYLGGTLVPPHINCDQTDTFSSLWRKVFSQIHALQEIRRMGFRPEVSHQPIPLSSHLEGDIVPDNVRDMLTRLSSFGTVIVIVDEFDRMPPGDSSRLFADTIKSLSDNSINATIILVGVADSVEELIGAHPSIERALVQVQMPRMSSDELRQIVRNGLRSLALGIDSQALERIVILSQGLPHYTHLLALYATRTAIEDGRRTVSQQDTEKALARAINKAQQSIVRDYDRSTASPRRDNLYREVLTACALAPKNALGYFAAADVRGPMSLIKRKPYEIPAFARHLNDFCDKARGPVLERSGLPRRYRYRFRNPLLQPYVVMQGLESRLIDWNMLGH